MTTELVREDSMALKVDGLRARPAQYMREAIAQAAAPGAARTSSVLESAMSAILLDVSVLYFKTSRSLRHIVGPNARNFRLLLEEQRAQLSAMIDQITERNRKLGVTVHKSVYQTVHQQGALDKDAAYIQPWDILDDLQEDNEELLALLKAARALCNGGPDIATASLIDIWIDEAARRNWVFAQAVE